MNQYLYNFFTFPRQADIKLPGIPIKIVMEAIQQASGKLVCLILFPSFFIYS